MSDDTPATADELLDGPGVLRCELTGHIAVVARIEGELRARLISADTLEVLEVGPLHALPDDDWEVVCSEAPVPSAIGFAGPLAVTRPVLEQTIADAPADALVYRDAAGAEIVYKTEGEYGGRVETYSLIDAWEGVPQPPQETKR